jgi:hypothetical protein
MSPFKYQARNEDAWQKRADQSGAQFDSYTKDSFKNYSLRAGENFIRILPPSWENAKHYGYDVWIHYNVGPNRGTVLCLSKMKNQKCPICEAHARAELAGREDAKELKAGRRVLVWILDRKEETTPLLWAMAWTVDRDISKICKDRQSGELYQIDHPDAGFDISFDKEGKDLQTKYTGFQLARKHSSVDKAHLDYIEKYPVPDTLLWRTYDEVKALFEGEASVDAPTTKNTKIVDDDFDKPTPIKAESKTETQLCNKEITIRGVSYACGSPQGHDGDHDFSVEVPALTLVPQEFCTATIPVMGKMYACGLVAPHKGDHDYTREVGNGKALEMPKPDSAAARGAARSSVMKTRFETGPK